MSDHSYFPFIGLEISHKDGALGVIQSLDRRKPYFFFVKFYDDVVSPQHASRLISRESESLLRRLPDEEPDADTWRLIVDCGETIAFERSKPLDWSDYLSRYLIARHSVTQVHRKIQLKDGAFYFGAVVGGIPDGNGVLRELDGSVYEGKFLFGKFEGNGTLTYQDKRIYQGMFHRGKARGHGKLLWPNGDCYVGEWRDGVYSGQGKLTHENGNIFQGEFRNNQKHGEGVLTDKLGAVVKKGHWFEGNFVEQIRPSYSPLKSYRTVDFIQGSREWLDWRMRGIGASDAPVIMNENPWKSKAYLLKEKLGETHVWAGNAATRRGQEFEPIIRAHIERLLDMPLKPLCVQSTESDMGWMRASLDGISGDGSRVFEIKFGEKVYGHVQKTNTIPGYHYGQLQHILAITDLPFIDYFCGFIDCPTIHIVVQRDEPYIEKMLNAEWEFVGSMEDAGHAWMNGSRQE
jgi:putative phage-type endonuclease